MFSPKFVKFTNNLSIRHKQYEPLLNRCVVLFDFASGLLRRLERRLGRLRLAALQPTVRTACEAALQTTACISLRRGSSPTLVYGPLSRGAAPEDRTQGVVSTSQHTSLRGGRSRSKELKHLRDRRLRRRGRDRRLRGLRHCD